MWIRVLSWFKFRLIFITEVKFMFSLPCLSALLQVTANLDCLHVILKELLL